VIATGMKEVGFKTLRILSTIHQPALSSARNLTVKNMVALITSTFNIDGSLVPVTCPGTCIHLPISLFWSQTKC
jgi:hypothetical protein